MSTRHFRVTVHLKPFFNGKEWLLTHLEHRAVSAEAARDYAETLYAAGIIVAYRVAYSHNGLDWYNHEFVKYLDESMSQPASWYRKLDASQPD